MDTKEKTPASGTKEAAPAQRRPRPQNAKAAERPAAPRQRRPDGSAPARRSAARPGQPEQPRQHAAQAPKKGAKKPASRPSLFAKKPKAPKGTDANYRPYKKATDAQKARRNQNIARKVQRFFSYQNPVAKLFYKEDPAVFGGTEESEKARAKQRKRSERRQKLAERLNTPAVIYTQPQAFNRSRLAVQLLTVLAVVLAVVLGMSVFFKVKTITVSGAKVYSAWTIREKSGINEGDNLLTFGRTKASGQIIANLPYVKSARIGIKLPDTVNIEIEEEAVVYSIQDQDGVWWLINSDGKVVEQSSATNARSYTQVLGVALNEPHPAEMGTAYEELPTETFPDGEYVPILISGAQRLTSALRILQALEDNDIVGEAASVDVSQLQDIILWYGTQYQVNLGNIDKMAYKIACMNDVILQMKDYQTGVLDISFTTWPDQVGYTPFG